MRHNSFSQTRRDSIYDTILLGSQRPHAQPQEQEKVFLSDKSMMDEVYSQKEL